MRGDLSVRLRSHLENEAAEGRLTLLGASDREWDVMVPSYWKESIALSLGVGARTLRGEAFFMRAPEDNPGQAYRLLLERNLESRLWRFAVAESGDVSLVVDVPVAALDEDLLDQLLGALVTLTDETYRPYFELAFQSALAEQVARGGPGLDRPPPWAKEWDRPKA